MYNKWVAYGQSKTANILFAVEVAQRLGSKGLKAFSLHPGTIMTNLGRFAAEQDFAELSEFLAVCSCGFWRDTDSNMQWNLTSRWVIGKGSKGSSGRVSLRGRRLMSSPRLTPSSEVGVLGDDYARFQS